VLGGLATGTLLGLLATVLPWTPSTLSVAAAAVAAVGFAAYDLQVPSVELPQRRALIPQEVFLRSREVGFLRFGLEFGSGARTYVTSAAPYAVVVLVLGMTDGALPGLLMGACFGLGRSLAPLQALVADDGLWAVDVGSTSRFTERAGSVVVAGAAAWIAVVTVIG
jgi:hypothetical protein